MNSDISNTAPNNNNVQNLIPPVFMTLHLLAIMVTTTSLDIGGIML